MQRAFSLVELSIVLVILGLLVGGILAGQALIRASELRAVSTEYSRYVAAVQSFRGKYMALPGDMPNATAFWGKDNVNCPADTGTTAVPGTCNGNGSGGFSNTATVQEVFRFWQQMALAGLVEGQYDGITHGTTTYSATTENSPASRLGSNALWYTTSAWTSAGTSTRFAVEYGQAMALGGVVVNDDPNGLILRPQELWSIDSKMDDGMPARGKIVARSWATCTTATANNQLDATYLLTSDALGCVIVYTRAF